MIPDFTNRVLASASEFNFVASLSFICSAVKVEVAVEACNAVNTCFCCSFVNPAADKEACA